MGLWSLITLPFRTTIRTALLVTSTVFFFIRLSWTITTLTPLFSYIAYVSFTTFILISALEPEIPKTIKSVLPFEATSFILCAAMSTVLEVPHYIIPLKIATILYVKLWGVFGYWLGWSFMLIDVLNIFAAVYFYAENIRAAESIAQQSSTPSDSARFSLQSLITRSLPPFYSPAQPNEMIIYKSVSIYTANDMLDESIVSMELKDQGLVDIYLYGSSTSPRPVVLYLHGGRWSKGSKELPTPLVPILAERGFLTVSLNYRLAPQYPQPAGLQDVHLALKWIKDNIAAYGGDASFILLAGDSAGGHLAQLAALQSVGSKVEVQGSILLFPALQVMNEFGTNPQERQNFVTYVCAGNEEEAAKLGLVRYLDANTAAPPTLAFHGLSDSLISSLATSEFQKRARAVGAAFELVTLPLTDHLYTMFNSPKAIATSEFCAEWAMNLYNSRKKIQ